MSAILYCGVSNCGHYLARLVALSLSHHGPIKAAGLAAPVVAGLPYPEKDAAGQVEQGSVAPDRARDPQGPGGARPDQTSRVVQLTVAWVSPWPLTSGVPCGSRLTKRNFYHGTPGGMLVRNDNAGKRVLPGVRCERLSQPNGARGGE